MTCHFCGEATRAEEPLIGCDCTTECKHCRHIGHEHYADGRCRGTVYDDSPVVAEYCKPHQYEPKEVGT